jgi:uncharacterized protein YjbI with pentapeptide repeats
LQGPGGELRGHGGGRRVGHPGDLQGGRADAQLDLATFQGLDARGFVFRECGLVEVDFSEADLRRASFVGSRLDGARLVRCDLREADFREATGYAIDVRDCQVKGARFSAAEALSLLDHFRVRID